MATSRTERVPTTPTRGQQLPDFTATDADGRAARPRDYYMRRNLALVFTHGPECPHCQSFLRRLARQQRGVEAEAGQAMIVVPAEVNIIRTLRDQLDLPYPVVADPDGAIHARYGLRDTDGTLQAAVFIADRYGTIFESSIAGAEHTMLDPDDVPGWLEFIACRCS